MELANICAIQRMHFTTAYFSGLCVGRRSGLASPAARWGGASRSAKLSPERAGGAAKHDALSGSPARSGVPCDHRCRLRRCAPAACATRQGASQPAEASCSAQLPNPASSKTFAAVITKTLAGAATTQAPTPTAATVAQPSLEAAPQKR